LVQRSAMRKETVLARPSAMPKETELVLRSVMPMEFVSGVALD